MDKPIKVSVDENNIVQMSIVGDLLEDKAGALALSLADVEKMMGDQYSLNKEKIKVLVDLSSFNGKYATKSFMQMIDFTAQTQAIVQKAGVYGGLENGRMAAEMVAALAHRNDIKVFATKAEALEWLNIN